MSLKIENIKKFMGWCPNAKSNETRKYFLLENFDLEIPDRPGGEIRPQKYYYKKAIKAGLIGAVLMIVIGLVTKIILYWSMTRPAVQEWMNQSANNTAPVPTNFSDVSPEVLILSFSLILAGLLIFVVYMLAGVIAAYYIAPHVRGTSLSNVIIQNVICGAIAGAVTQAVSTPFSMLLVLLFDLFPASRLQETERDILQWLSSQLVTQYVYMLAVAIILGTIGAIVCGIAAKALCRSMDTV
jgi:hypothetical protein